MLSRDSEFKEFKDRISRLLNILPLVIQIRAGFGEAEGRGRYSIEDKGDSYLIIAEVPGASKEDVKVYAKESDVYVYAERRLGPAIESLPRKYRIRIKLEEPIDVSRTRARYENGLVIIEAPKKTPGAEIKVE